MRGRRGILWAAAAACYLMVPPADRAEAGCGDCHGYPPVSSMAGKGVPGNYENARVQNYAGGGGAHSSPNHVAPSVTAAQGWAPCVPCHYPSINHNTLSTTFNRQYVGVVIATTYKAKAGFPYYGIGSGAGGSWTCSGVSCHGGQVSPRWDMGTLNVNTQCTKCHIQGSTQFQSAISGLHSGRTVVSNWDHWTAVGTGAQTCGVGFANACHQGPPANHFGANLNDSALVELTNENANLLPGIVLAAGPNHDPNADTCVLACHSDGGRWARLNDRNKAILAAKTSTTVCATCHGTWLTGWVAGAGVMARPDMTALGGPGALTAGHDADWSSSLPGGISANHEDCKVCHGMNSLTDHAQSYLIGSTTLWDPSGVNGLHGNGKIEMSGPSADVNLANNQLQAGVGYNGNGDTVLELSDYSCTAACHPAGGYNLGASAWVVNYKDFSGSTCIDADHDGSYSNCLPLDCDDTNPNVRPGAAEVCNDGVDNNCDGRTDCADFSCSGVMGTTRIGTTSPFCAPTCTDGDGDGYSREGGLCGPVDCDDGNPSAHPYAAEVCDGADNDCDGSVDEGLIQTYYRDADGDTWGMTSATVQTCGAPAGYVARPGDCNDGNAAVNPGMTEIPYDGIDQNCDTLDLTIRIDAAKTTWSKSAKKVTVQATSSYNGTANLRVSSFSGWTLGTTWNSMTWNSGGRYWSYTKTGVTAHPGNVTVSGPEGSVTGAVKQVK